MVLCDQETCARVVLDRAGSHRFNVYLRAYGTVSDARASIGRYLTFYNSRCLHSSLDRKTPDQACFNQPLLAAA